MIDAIIGRDGFKVCGATCKTTRGCGKLKPLDEFHTSKRTPDGRKPVCAECCNAELLVRVDRDRDVWNAAQRERRKTHRAANLDSVRAKDAERARRAYRDNPEPKRERNRCARRRAGEATASD